MLTSPTAALVEFTNSLGMSHSDGEEVRRELTDTGAAFSGHFNVAAIDDRCGTYLICSRSPFVVGPYTIFAAGRRCTWYRHACRGGFCRIGRAPGLIRLRDRQARIDQPRPLALVDRTSERDDLRAQRNPYIHLSIHTYGCEYCRQFTDVRDELCGVNVDGPISADNKSSSLVTIAASATSASATR